MQSAAPARLRINRSAGPPQNRLLHNGALSEVAELASAILLRPRPLETLRPLPAALQLRPYGLRKCKISNWAARQPVRLIAKVGRPTPALLSVEGKKHCWLCRTRKPRPTGEIMPCFLYIKPGPVRQLCIWHKQTIRFTGYVLVLIVYNK